MRRHTLEPLCQNIGRRTFSGHGRIEDALFAPIALFLVVDGYAADAAGVEALAAAAALQAGSPLDGTLFLESATARGRRPLV